MFKSTARTSNVVDQAAAAANKGINATQHALEEMASGVSSLRDEVGSHLDDATEHANALVHRGVDALRGTSQRLRVQARHASDGTTNYIRQEPVKAVLIAAATGAVLVALIGLLTRSRRDA